MVGSLWDSVSDRGTVADLVHYASALPASFDYHDDASTWEMCDKLDRQVTVLNKGQFNKLQQAYGLNYDPDSLLWDIGLRPTWGRYQRAIGIGCILCARLAESVSII